MTTAADDTAAEEAFEAYLAGRPVADEGAGVAAFAAAVRATATEPGRPNAALAELLATGLLVDQPAPSPRTASSRRRRRLAMLFPALLAKLLSAGAIAQAATGAGVAVVVVASAGAAGVLPDPVQETFSTIVGTDTEQTDTGDPAPVDDATTQQPTDVASPDTEGTDSTGTDGTENEGSDTSTEVTGPDPSQPFGQWIDGRVEHGEVDGRRVSDWAHDRNDQRRHPDAEDGDDAGEGGDDASTQRDGGGRGNGGGHGSGGRGDG